MPDPVFEAPGGGESISGLNCRVSSASTGGACCAFEFTLPSGDGVPLHIHEREDELYYVLEGGLEIACGGKVFTAEAGSMAMLPRNTPHALRNRGVFPARVLAVFIPGGFDNFVRELAALSAQDAADESSATPFERSTASA